MTQLPVPRRRGLLAVLLHGQLGELLLDGELAVPPGLEAEFAAERRAERAAERARVPQPRRPD
ncbi:MAG: hypothetical protein ACYDB7_04635 [Mycobacteriales bacterium]